MKTVKFNLVAIALIISSSAGICAMDSDGHDHRGMRSAMMNLQPEQRAIYVTLSPESRQEFLDLSDADRAAYIEATPEERSARWPAITSLSERPMAQTTRTDVGGSLWKRGTAGNLGYTPGVRRVQQ